MLDELYYSHHQPQDARKQKTWLFLFILPDFLCLTSPQKEAEVKKAKIPRHSMTKKSKLKREMHA